MTLTLVTFSYVVVSRRLVPILELIVGGCVLETSTHDLSEHTGPYELLRVVHCLMIVDHDVLLVLSALRLI